MKLLIEIGNTSLKWALLQGDTPGPMAAARHFGALPIDVLASWEQLQGIDQVLLASVGPEAVVDAVTSAVAAYWQCPLTRIKTAAEAQGVKIAYADPERLGVDRFLALIGAHWIARSQDWQGPGEQQTPPVPTLQRHSNCATLIIDAGTAITFDALLADGRHRGGQILPGISLLRESLLRGTRLPPHQTQPDQRQGLQDPWATDTGPAIVAASLQAPAALAEHLRDNLRQETGMLPRLILTGGDAEQLAPLLSEPLQRQPELVLLGLARVAQH